MKPETRTAYVDYISRVMRESSWECGIPWPEKTMIVVHTYARLADLDAICGLEIMVCNTQTSKDFFFVIPAEYEPARALLKSAKEFMDIHPMKWSG